VEGQEQRSRLTVSHPNVAISLLGDGTNTSCLTQGITHEPNEIDTDGTGAVGGCLPNLG